jgi:hypothetical protein
MSQRRRIGTAVLAALAAVTGLVLIATGGGVRPAAAATAPRRAGVDPANFVRTITNPYLPYRPGSVWVYTGVKDGQTQRDVVRVTHRTRMIMGVKATTVLDVATHGGKVLEQTTDWYAQDKPGNVWYFGEATKARNPDGTFDTSGSWLTGVHGARPGIMMTAHPAVGDAHRQEFWRGHAEDQYWLVELGASVTVPAGSYSHAARTIEWSRLEPGVIDEKFYVPGVGVVKETAASGPKEVATLARYTAP